MSNFFEKEIPQQPFLVTLPFQNSANDEFEFKETPKNYYQKGFIGITPLFSDWLYLKKHTDFGWSIAMPQSPIYASTIPGKRVYCKKIKIISNDSRENFSHTISMFETLNPKFMTNFAIMFGLDEENERKAINMIIENRDFTTAAIWRNNYKDTPEIIQFISSQKAQNLTMK